MIVTTDHLSKWYGQVIGLNDVTLTVPPGITGLLGPNGAGKSTFMKLMTGQLKPSKGSIRVLGESSGAAMLQLLDGQKPDISLPQVQLIVRESTAAPRTA